MLASTHLDHDQHGLELAVQLEGVARDNEKQIGPALRELHQVLAMLQDKETELQALQDQSDALLQQASRVLTQVAPQSSHAGH